MRVQFGSREMEIGADIGPLRESNDIMGNMDALRSRMAEDGYLLIRRLHDPANVRAARKMLLENLAANNQIDMRFPLDEGVINPENGDGAFLGGANSLTHKPELLSVVESPELLHFFGEFLGGDAMTFDFKWLRAVKKGHNSGAHFDVIYMGRGTLNLYTVWTPLGDLSYEMGTLAILPGAHRSEAAKKLRETYGKMDVDRDKVQGWYSNDPFELVEKYGGKWLSTEFQMGDALIFGMYTMHASLNNGSNRYRLSCDTRYQRADEPIDERWIGKNPKAHYGWRTGELVTMEEARRRWGV